MRYFVAEAKNEKGEWCLRPNWFATEFISEHGYAKLACEEFLRTRDAKKSGARIVEVEITRV